ncbi:PIG-L deacetylase family protein [Sciscionella marina]|uniref:PIG-L deacetylase family protein n=1 Tax=Sciscionella marina TaxID=508770 RepID=UPI00035CE175|nr:PIG-L deacetylase family protein [Sciscionella marina]
MVPESDVSRVLVVAAHPDDVDFGAAGTVARWTSTGSEVAYCICTSGDAVGISGLGREQVGQARRREQLAAAGEVGVADVTFLGYPDGRVEPSLALRRDITRVIRKLRPERVLTWSPEINWQHFVTAHPDHRAVGEATIAAVYPDARNPYAHPELLAEESLRPWVVPELWIADPPAHLRTQAVDVTDTFGAKLAALRAHRSQTGHLDSLESSLRGYLEQTAQRHGLPAGRLAEAFQVVQTG